MSLKNMTEASVDEKYERLKGEEKEGLCWVGLGTRGEVEQEVVEASAEMLNLPPEDMRVFPRTIADPQTKVERSVAFEVYVLDKWAPVVERWRKKNMDRAKKLIRDFAALAELSAPKVYGFDLNRFDSDTKH
mgnify:CR=1 FL=1